MLTPDDYCINGTDLELEEGASWLTAGRSAWDDLLSMDDYGMDGIDLDLEEGAGSQQVGHHVTTCSPRTTMVSTELTWWELAHSRSDQFSYMKTTVSQYLNHGVIIPRGPKPFRLSLHAEKTNM